MTNRGQFLSFEEVAGFGQDEIGLGELGWGVH